MRDRTDFSARGWRRIELSASSSESCVLASAIGFVWVKKLETGMSYVFL